MPVMKDPKSNQILEIGVHEGGRLRTLEKLGWIDVSGLPITVGIIVEEEVKTPQRVGDPVLVVTEKPVAGAQELPVAAKAKPKRKK